MYVPVISGSTAHMTNRQANMQADRRTDTKRTENRLTITQNI